MTLNDILKKRESELQESIQTIVAQQLEPEEEQAMEQEPSEYTEPSEEINLAEELEKEQKADAEELTRLVKNMMRYEKEAVVKGVPTDILQNEITRRMNRDHEALEDIKKILGVLKEY